MTVIVDDEDDAVNQYIISYGESDRDTHPFSTEQLDRFAALVRDNEREAIINLIAAYGGSVQLEAAIRARGNI